MHDLIEGLPSVTAPQSPLYQTQKRPPLTSRGKKEAPAERTHPALADLLAPLAPALPRDEGKRPPRRQRAEPLPLRASAFEATRGTPDKWDSSRKRLRETELPAAAAPRAPPSTTSSTGLPSGTASHPPLPKEKTPDADAPRSVRWPRARGRVPRRRWRGGRERLKTGARGPLASVLPARRRASRSRTGPCSAKSASGKKGPAPVAHAGEAAYEAPKAKPPGPEPPAAGAGRPSSAAPTASFTVRPPPFLRLSSIYIYILAARRPRNGRHASPRLLAAAHDATEPALLAAATEVARTKGPRVSTGSARDENGDEEGAGPIHVPHARRRRRIRRPLRSRGSWMVSRGLEKDASRTWRRVRRYETPNAAVDKRNASSRPRPPSSAGRAASFAPPTDLETGVARLLASSPPLRRAPRARRHGDHPPRYGRDGGRRDEERAGPIHMPHARRRRRISPLVALARLVDGVPCAAPWRKDVGADMSEVALEDPRISTPSTSKWRPAGAQSAYFHGPPPLSRPRESSISLLISVCTSRTSPSTPACTTRLAAPFPACPSPLRPLSGGRSSVWAYLCPHLEKRAGPDGSAPA
ncbi:hypothetical protein FB451DRAFT_1561769 [Mycena latifolia]|nr:hypothetical protein FB451DRAFT_1561769 [Mycena latifolia]